jgi:gliding motility-associated-like protein
VTLNQFGCSDTTIIPITVYPKPQPSFTANPNQQNWPPDPVTFTNNTPNLNDYTYFWDLGDTANGTSVDISPTYDFGTFGTFTVTLTATSQFGCTDSTTRLVTIFPSLPVADFVGQTSDCVPFTFKFNNTSQFGLTYRWEFSDGSVYFTEDVEKTFFDPGVYDVKLITTGLDGFQDSIQRFGVVTGYANPSANFFSRDSVFVGLNEINFSNESRNATDFFWDFGDGTTSDERSPTKNYRFEGEYDVTMVAFNTINDTLACTDTATKLIYVLPVGDIIVPNAFTPVEGGPTGGAVNPFDRFNNTVFYPVIRKEFVDLKFEVFNRWGEPIFQSNTVNVGWDGYVNGEPAPQGVYIYRVQVEFADGSKETKVGDVTLLR